MPPSIQEIVNIIYLSIDEINELQPQNKRVPKSMESVLLGQESALDSLGFINFVVTLEQKIQEKFGIEISLTEDEEFTRVNSSYRTVDSLARFLQSKLSQ
jgi:acyl carrier protein